MISKMGGSTSGLLAFFCARLFAMLLAIAGIPLFAIGAPATEKAKIRAMIDAEDLKAISEFLSQSKVQIDANFLDGSSLLYTAAKDDKPAVVIFLVAQHANINEKNMQLETPLYAAVGSGSLATAEVLLDQGADVSAQNTAINRTALHRAIETANKDMARLLIKHGAKFDANDLYQVPPLSFAVLKNDSEMVRLLISSDPQKRTNPNLLDIAAMGGSVEIVNMLEEIDPSLHQATPQRCEALAFAAARNDDQRALLQILIDDGASIEKCRNNKGEDPALASAARGSLTNLRFLLSKGAKPNSTPDFEYQLLTSARDTDALEILTSAGLQVDIKGWQGNTALWSTNAKKAEFLIGHGVDPDVENEVHETALLNAVRMSDSNLVAVLIKHGVKVNVLENRHGRSALEIAAWNGSIDIVKMLVRAGADVNFHDGSGEATLYWARTSEVFEYLMEHGAKKMSGEEIERQLQRTLENYDLEYFGYLITHGGNPNAKDKDGVPLYDRMRRDEVRDLLAKLGAKVPAEAGDRAIRSRDAKACQFVTDRANAGTLDELKIPFVEPKGKLLELLREKKLQGRVAQFYLNGNDLAYAVFDEHDKLARFTPKLTFISANGQILETRTRDHYVSRHGGLPSLLQIAFLNIDGLIYELDFADNYLIALFRTRKDNVKIQVCEFTEKPPAIEKLVISKDSALCNDALEGKLNYLEPQSLASSQSNSSAPFNRDTPHMDYVADIDNDGSKRHFVVAKYIGMLDGPWACDEWRIFVDKKDSSSSDAELTEKLRGDGCRDTMERPFLYDGKWYIEGKYDPHAVQYYHDVKFLQSGHVETICKFEVRPTQTAIVGNEMLHQQKGKPSPVTYALSLPELDELSEVLDAGGLTSGSILIDHYVDRTVADEAIINGQDRALSMLLDHGFDPTSNFGKEQLSPKDQGLPPLATAIEFGTPRSVKILLEHGAIPEQEWTANSFAHYLPYGSGPEYQLEQRRGWYREKLRLLLEHGADPRPIAQQLLEKAADCKDNSNDVHWEHRSDTFGQAKQVFEDAGNDETVVGVYVSQLGQCGAVQKQAMVEMLWTYLHPKNCDTSHNLSENLPCLIQRLKRADKSVSDGYQIPIGNHNPEATHSLQQEYATWLKQRDEQCQIKYPWPNRGGWQSFVLTNPNQAVCALRVTEERAEL